VETVQQDLAAQVERLAGAVHGDECLARRAQRHLTEVLGRMNRSAPTRTTSPSMMAIVNGSLIRKVEPDPTAVSISIFPRRRSMLRRTTSMPTPRPETAVTFSAVEKPGAKIRARMSSRSSSTPGATRPSLRLSG